MSERTLENYIRQLLESHTTPTVTVAWQGGEPTLMGLDFFKRSVEFVEQYRRPDQEVEYTFQTNGVLLDDDWCQFLKANNFLVGLSVDGPEEIHDTYRVNRGGDGTFKQVMRGWEALRRNEVDFNILCTVNAANQHHGRAVYRFFRDELGATWMQFIPIVERATAETLPIANQGWSEQPGESRLLYTQTGNLVTERSVGGEQYGRFLVDIYEEWLRGDVGTVYVQLFDVTLHAYFGQHLLCIHAPTCGYGPALEHNGDLYTCDHFVEPDFLLGNINDEHMLELVASPQMREFGDNKRDKLTQSMPGLRRAHVVQRRLSQGPLHGVARGRAGPQLPVRGAVHLLQPRAAHHEHHGAVGAAQPAGFTRDGVRAGRGRQARPQRPVPLRQRPQVQAVSRAALVVSADLSQGRLESPYFGRIVAWTE